MAYFSVTNLSLSNQDIFDAKTIFLSNIEFTYHHILYSLTKKDLTEPAARAFVRNLKVGKTFFWGGEDSNLNVFKKLLKSVKNFPFCQKVGGRGPGVPPTFAPNMGSASSSINSRWVVCFCLPQLHWISKRFSSLFFEQSQKQGRHCVVWTPKFF